jgi:HTH-type transcriptional regulator/antitoxin HigA
VEQGSAPRPLSVGPTKGDKRTNPHGAAENRPLRIPENGRMTMTTATRSARLNRSQPHVLRNDEEYEAALAEVDAILKREPEPGTPEADWLELLVVLIESYEREHYPMGGTSTPQSILDFMLDQRGMSRGDLSEIMGGKSRVSEFFAGKRHLSLTQIRRLRHLLRVPADVLI